MPRLRRVALRNLEMAGFADRERIADGVFRSIAPAAGRVCAVSRITRQNVERLDSL